MPEQPQAPQAERHEPPWQPNALLAAVLVAALVAGILYYARFARPVDKLLAKGAFSETQNIFAAPGTITVGDPLTEEQFVAELRHGAYSAAPANPVGWYRTGPQSVDVFPGKEFAGAQPTHLEFERGRVSRIVALKGGAARSSFDLGPPLLANLGGERERRLLVRYGQIPPCVVHAVISIEDKRFFDHSGVDLLRILKAAYVDLKDGRKEQGASTLTMQLARSFWLDPDKRWKRKVEELLIALHLEQKLTKQQIFEDYANQVYLGSRDGYSVTGLGEAAHAYFSKDVSQLKPAEAALLAGIIQRPAYFNPFRYPDRTLQRRNLVLSLMQQNGYLTGAEYRQESAAPLGLNPEAPASIEGGFFIGLMNEELHERLQDSAVQAHQVFTTLDPALQEAARNAVDKGMRSVDRMVGPDVRRRSGLPQVALIALDPHTGEIRALVGGRDFAGSQLDHALAMRQPGSVFKPFVFAAALNSGYTPATIIDDSPTTFFFASEVYRPENFHNEYMGKVTLETALAESLNSATVQLAQEVGFGRVLELSRAAGLTDAMEPTPASALGAYETSPLAIAEAYTIFANHGVRVTPTTLALVKTADGKVLYQEHPESRMVLDPRVAYQVNSMMQQVLQTGTGASATARGFSLPAAGKTGTTHDGWFAGFTTKLLCVVWVGYDDGRDLHIDGAQSALPIWTEFMQQAAALDRYSNPQPFQPPPGVISVRICATSGQVAGPYCPRAETAAFISGTEPRTLCRTHVAPRVPQVIVSKVEEAPEPPDGRASGTAPPAPAPPAPVRVPPPTQAPPLPAVLQPQPVRAPAPVPPPATAPVQPPERVQPAPQKTPPGPQKTTPPPATDVPDSSPEPPPDSQ